MSRILFVLFIFISIHSRAVSNKIKSDTTSVTEGYVLYKVFQDDSNISISVSTKDKKTMLTLLRFGITVSFDANGEKNNEVYVKYPQEMLQPNIKIGDIFEVDQAIDNLDLKKLIKNLPKEAEYGYFNNVQQFHIGLNSLDIGVAFSSHKNGLLEYKLRVPKNRIRLDSESDFSKLSIGVLSGKNDDIKFEQDKKQEMPNLIINEGRSRRQTDNRQRNIRSIRNRRGGRVSRRSVGDVKVVEKQANVEEALVPVINFWFDAKLKD